jgi:calcium-dependent protein kinase
VLVNKAQTYGDINNLDIRIIDFGLAKVLSSRRVRDQEKVGTYTHMAPEVINGIYSVKCDVWSAGIVLYSMVAGMNPFKKATKERTFENILKGEL